MARTVRSCLFLLALLAGVVDAGLYENWTGTSPFQFTSSSGANLVGGDTKYMPITGVGLSGTENIIRQFSPPFPVIFRNLAAAVDNSPGGGNSVTVTLRCGGADTALTVTLTSATTVVDSTHSFVSGGHAISGSCSFKAQATASIASPTTVYASVQVEPIGGSNPVPQMFETWTTTSSIGGTVNRVLNPISGGGTPGDPTTSTCNANAVARWTMPGVLRNLTCSTMCGISGGTITVGLAPFVSGCTTFQTTSPLQVTLSSANGTVTNSTNTLAVTAGQGLIMNYASSGLSGDCGFRCDYEFNAAGGVSPTAPVYTKSADYTIVPADLVMSQTTTFICDTSGAARTLTLPAANAAPWKTVRVKREGSTNKCTVTRAGSDTIFDGSAVNSRDLLVNGESVDMTSDGVSSWPMH